MVTAGATVRRWLIAPLRPPGACRTSPASTACARSRWPGCCCTTAAWRVLGRVPRGRRLLRPQRLPDHVAAAQRAHAARAHQPGGVLAAPRAAAAAGRVPRRRRLHAGRGDVLPVAVPRARGDAIASFFYFNNWHQAFAHESYFAALRAAADAPAPVVAGRRGAVLPRVADRARGVPEPARALADGARDDHRRRRVGAGDGAAVPARARPVARLLRHRHARFGAAGRRAAGVRWLPLGGRRPAPTKRPRLFARCARGSRRWLRSSRR